MRVSLLKPPTSEVMGLEMITLAEPLGLECIAAVLEAQGHDCAIVDMRIDGVSKGLAKIGAFAPDVVGIQCNFTTERHRALNVVRQVKQILPDALVVVGGHDASRSPDWFNQHGIAVVAIGDGETVMPDLVRAWQGGRDLTEVAGLAVNTPDGQVHTGTAAQVEFTDDLPMPARHLISEYAGKYYIQLWRPMALLETARGCPFRCSFCSVWKFNNGTYREKPIARVVDELSRIEAPYVFITDDTFWVNPARSEELAHAITKAGIRKHFIVQSRTDVIVRNRELVEQWKDCGKLTVFLGVEKVDDEGLTALNKRNTAANNEAALEILQSLGIGYTLTMIVDPDWGLKDFAKLHDWVERHGSYSSGFSVLTPLPGTDLWDQIKDSVTTSDWDMFDLEHAVLPTRLPLEQFYAEYARLWKHVLDLRYQRRGYLKTHVGMVAAAATGKVPLSMLRRGLIISKRMCRTDRYLDAHRKGMGETNVQRSTSNVQRPTVRKIV